MSDGRFEGDSIEEIVCLVGQLNDEIFNQTGRDHGCAYRPLVAHFDGDDCASTASVYLIDICIWNSDCNNRGFDESFNVYQPLKEFLIQEINRVVSELKEIKL